MTYKPGTLYSGLHCWYRYEKTGVGISITGKQVRVHGRPPENQTLDGRHRTHLLYKLLHTLDNMLVELKDKERNENIFNPYYRANKVQQ